MQKIEYPGEVSGNSGESLWSICGVSEVFVIFIPARKCMMSTIDEILLKKTLQTHQHPLHLCSTN